MVRKNVILTLYTKRNAHIIHFCLFTFLLLFFSFKNSNIKDSFLNEDLIDSETVCSLPDLITHTVIPKSTKSEAQNYDLTIQWNKTNFEINNSISFPSSTSVTIDSCNISFLATNSTALTWEIGTGSRLEIHNSNLFRNKSSAAPCLIRFLGGTIIVSNSTFSDFGQRGSSGFLISNSAVVIEGSKFLQGYTGIDIRDCYWVNVSNNFFIKNIYDGIIGRSSNNLFFINNSFYSHPGSGISLKSCNNINVSYSYFSGQKTYAIEFQSCSHTFVGDNSVEHFGTGVKWDNEPGNLELYEDIIISNNSLFNGTADGIYIKGVGRYFDPFQYNPFVLTFGGCGIIDCDIIQMGRYGIYLSGYSLYAARNTIRGSLGGIRCGEIVTAVDYYPAFDISLINNTISYVKEFGIKYDDLTTTEFEFVSNNITHSNGKGISFYGRVGGTELPAIIVGNIINGTAGAAIDGQAVISLGNNYYGHFLNVNIYKNAFLNCQGGYSRFDVVGYSVLQVNLDNGKWGNYWDGKQFNDQDNNMVGDNYFSASVDWGLVDRAPLLSLDLLKEETIGSTHPRDLTVVQNENQTIEWSISPGTEVGVFLDGQPVNYNINSSLVTINLLDLRLSVGTHNVTLQLNSTVENSSLLYCDLVWLHVDADLSWMNDLITIIQLIFVVIIALAFGTAMYIRQIMKRRVFRKQFAVEFRGIIDISEAANNLREERELERK